MVRIIMCGCNGKMGRVISDLAAEDTQVKIVAGVDFVTEQNYDYPVYSGIFLFHALFTKEILKSVIITLQMKWVIR